MTGQRALIVIDMQRGFLEAGYPLFCGETTRRVIEPIRRLIAEGLKCKTPLFFTADTHEPGDKEFEVFPPHCLRGSVEAQIVPELADYLRYARLIEKRRFSAFFDTDLHHSLQQGGVTRLTVCGVCTDICVLHTVADARMRDYEVEVVRDCVASFDEKAQSFALDHMEKVLGARIV
jgi:nicotinamidase-related amidase